METVTQKTERLIREINRIHAQYSQDYFETVKPKKSMAGVTPPQNEHHVDHIDAKSNGGSGTPRNGQVLCRACNLKKSNR